MSMGWIEKAWEAYKRNAGAIIIANIVLWLISAVLIMVPILILHSQALLVPILLIAAIVYFYLSAGLLGLYRDALEGKADLGKWINRSNKYFIPLLVVGIVNSLILVIITGILFLVPGTPPYLKSVAGILAIIIGFYLYLRLVWSWANVIIKDLGGIEALTESWRSTGNNIMKAVSIVVIVVALGILGIVVSLIPLLGALIELLVISPLITMVYLEASRE